MAFRRTERIASLIRSLIADAIQNRLADPRIPPITSVTRVEVSDDLSIAQVHVSVMASDSDQRLCLTALRHAAGRLRRGLGPHLRLRQVPRLAFRLDDSLRRSFETVSRIDDAMRELGEVPVWEQEDDAQGADAESSDAASPESAASPPGGSEGEAASPPGPVRSERTPQEDV